MGHDLNILIADDHPVFREGLRRVIESNKTMHIVAEAADGEEALLLMQNKGFDVAILDVDMPGKSGLEIMRILGDRDGRPEVIFLTMYDDAEIFNEAMDLGVTGYVLKESAVRDILESIRAVSTGRTYISPAISGHLINRLREKESLRKTLPSLNDLTSTERRILRLIANGETSKGIAHMLSISPKTVDNHRQNIAIKLQIHGTHSLFKFAVQNRDRL